MNKLLKLPTDLTRSRGMTVILTANKVRAGMTELIANVILSSPLFVIAGGDWMPAFALTSLVDRNAVDVRRVLKHVYTARASTCFELFDSLANRRSNGEPILVLDFLHTFYDPKISLPVRLFKVRQCCHELKRLAFYRPVIVITQDNRMENCDDFISILTSIADKTLLLECEVEVVKQIALF